MDTGVWISYIENTAPDLTSVLQETLFSPSSMKCVYGNAIMLSEIGYILGRGYGWINSQHKVGSIESVLSQIPVQKLFRLAAGIKCQFPISLADCYSIATGKVIGCPVIFCKEAELSEDRVQAIEEKYAISLLII